MNTKFALLAAGLFAVSGAAHATDLNYDYLEVGYTIVDLDDFNADLTALSLGGSFLVTEEVYVFGNYADGRTENFNFFGDRGRLDLSGYTLGVGYRYALSRLTDLNFAAAFERQKFSGRRDLSYLGSDSENGYSLTVGLRSLVSPQFEFLADVTYIDVGDDDTVLGLGGLWHFHPQVALGAGVTLGSDATGYGATLRFKF
jgi:hypothetical protein